MSATDVANEKKSSAWSPTSKTDKTRDERSRCGAVCTGITSYSPLIGFERKNLESKLTAEDCLFTFSLSRSLTIPDLARLRNKSGACCGSPGRSGEHLQGFLRIV